MDKNTENKSNKDNENEILQFLIQPTTEELRGGLRASRWATAEGQETTTGQSQGSPVANGWTRPNPEELRGGLRASRWAPRDNEEPTGTGEPATVVNPATPPNQPDPQQATHQQDQYPRGRGGPRGGAIHPANFSGRGSGHRGGRGRGQGTPGQNAAAQPAVPNNAQYQPNAQHDAPGLQAGQQPPQGPRGRQAGAGRGCVCGRGCGSANTPRGPRNDGA